jgi:hypothetical protein
MANLVIGGWFLSIIQNRINGKYGKYFVIDRTEGGEKAVIPAPNLMPSEIPSCFPCETCRMPVV